MKIGLALSGGGVRGAAHIGAIKALEENGIEIKSIAGTSEPEIQTEEEKVEETALITREENIWYKRIIDKIKSFFKKF